jgi:hypothetical protein
VQRVFVHVAELFCVQVKTIHTISRATCLTREINSKLKILMSAIGHCTSLPMNSKLKTRVFLGISVHYPYQTI